MNLPLITCCCVTYARVPELQEALACFLAQDYKGPKRLIIFNSYANQTLEFDHPEVHIINAPTRPATLGQCRNRCIEAAAGESLIACFDDDDGYGPNFLSLFAGTFQSGDGWVRQEREFYMDAHRIKGIAAGTPNLVAFTKHAWNTIGGYKELNCGEDRDFIGRLTSRYSGSTVFPTDDEISFFRSWGSGIYHISGQGDDSPGMATGSDRVAEWIEMRRASGLIPEGKITLTPKFEHDYPKMRAEFVRGKTLIDTSKLGKVGLVILGRYGDILNILPVAKAIADRWSKPHFFVARQFADVLEGVTYVQPQILDMPYDHIHDALKIAKGRCQTVLCAQTWGKDFRNDMATGTYNTEGWRFCGFGPSFPDLPGFPLLLDNRSLTREKALADSLPMAGKPTILCNLCGSISSPFKDCQRVYSAIAGRWDGKFNVLDISQVRGERIYDLLGVFDRAVLLVTADTATLHLAAASKIPVIAFVNDEPWKATAPRCHTVLKLRYSDVLDNFSAVNEVISKL